MQRYIRTPKVLITESDETKNFDHITKNQKQKTNKKRTKTTTSFGLLSQFYRSSWFRSHFLFNQDEQF